MLKVCWCKKCKSLKKMWSWQCKVNDFVCNRPVWLLWQVRGFFCSLFFVFCWRGCESCKIGATFFFVGSVNRRRSTQIFDDHSENIGTHNFSTHKKRIYSTGTHQEIRHTNYKHSNQSQILSYIRLDKKKEKKKQKDFLSATSMLSLWCTGRHCHTHLKIRSSTHNKATGLSGGWWAVMGHTHSGWYTMVHNTNWLCWLSAPLLSLGLYKKTYKNNKKNNNKNKLLHRLCRNGGSDGGDGCLWRHGEGWEMALASERE